MGRDGHWLTDTHLFSICSALASSSLGIWGEGKRMGMMMPIRSPPAWKDAPCQPNPAPTPSPAPAPRVKSGRSLLEEHRLSLPWRNTNTHQCSLETCAWSPGRDRRQGNGGGQMGLLPSGMGDGHRVLQQHQVSAAPPAHGCTPHPNRWLWSSLYT